MTTTTESRFSNLDIDDAPAAPPSSTPAPRTLKNPGVDVGNVSEEGRDRALGDEAAARAAGFDPKDPIYEVGSRVNDTGVKNFTRSRAAYDEMPFVSDVCEALESRVQAEKRLDYVVKAPSLSVSGVSGELATPGVGYPMTDRAVQTLSGFVTDGGGRYLAGLHTQGRYGLLATNLNDHFARAVRVDARATEKARRENPNAPEVIRPVELKLRTRQNTTGRAGDREVWSVVGPQYQDHGVDKIARQVIEAAGQKARGEVRYDGYTATIDVIFHTDVPGSSAVAGEFFKAGVRVRAADDGSGSITVQALLWRNLCLNLIVIDRQRQVTLRRRHVGTGIAQDVAQGIQVALGKVEHFRRKWDEATLENLLERHGVGEPEQVFRGLVAAREVWVPGCTADELVERLMGAWACEQGASKASFLNAITRAAHQYEWHRDDAPEYLEERAGQLLYQRVWNVQLEETGGAA
jgi:hypothetical protein